MITRARTTREIGARGSPTPRAARGDRARGRATIRRGRSTHPRRGLSRRRGSRRGARGAAPGTSPPTQPRGASRSTTASRRIASETRAARAWTASCARGGESSTDEGVSSDVRTTGRVREGAAAAKTTRARVECADASAPRSITARFRAAVPLWIDLTNDPAGFDRDSFIGGHGFKRVFIVKCSRVSKARRADRSLCHDLCVTIDLSVGARLPSHFPPRATRPTPRPPHSAQMSPRATRSKASAEETTKPENVDAPAAAAVVEVRAPLDAPPPRSRPFEPPWKRV